MNTTSDASALTLAAQHQLEIEGKERFGFRANWQRYLNLLDERRIGNATASLQHFLDVKELNNKSFLEIGSGNGLFSLAARRLGARVHSLDYDTNSVAYTEGLLPRFHPTDPLWTTTVGSVLESDTLPAPESYDIVYSWDVLHHTGNPWLAAENAAARVAPGGKLFIALYNDQGWRSKGWLKTKQLYNALPASMRWLVLWPCTVLLWGPKALIDTFKGNPLARWNAYSNTGQRGMSAWTDVIDWVGGFPFEVSSPEQVVNFHRERGFVLTRLRTCGSRLGCNQFVFQRG